jgi:anti-sigma B factor antagonist
MAAAFHGTRVAPALDRTIAEMAECQISTRQIDQVTILDLSGRLVLGAATESLGNALQQVIAKGERKILLNMKLVTQVDTTGISTIVRAFVSLQRSGGKLGLFHVSDRVRQILDLTRLLNVIPSFADEPDALAKIR